ncbi:MAG: RNA polymerase sigma factor [Acidimicrobiales bacterium]
MRGRVVWGDTSDEELAAVAAAGDGDAFRELIQRHRRLIVGLCGRLARSQDEADEAVQIVMVAVHRGLGSFEGRSKFSTWLHQVARNAIMGELRRRRPVPVEVDPESEPAAPGPGPESTVVDVAAVRWALRRLPEEYRETLILREYYGLSVEEIAEIQIISQGTVKSRLSRARAGLALLLEPGRDR